MPKRQPMDVILQGKFIWMKQSIWEFCSGALWGSLDIQKMGMLGSLKGLTVTMKKHPASMKLTTSEMQEKLQISLNDPTKEYVIYEGPVRPLCPIAPNNVNTMAVASLGL